MSHIKIHIIIKENDDKNIYERSQIKIIKYLNKKHFLQDQIIKLNDDLKKIYFEGGLKVLILETKIQTKHEKIEKINKKIYNVYSDVIMA